MFLSRKNACQSQFCTKTLSTSFFCYVQSVLFPGVENKKNDFLFPVESQNTLKVLSGIGRMSIINKFKAFAPSSYSLY